MLDQPNQNNILTPQQGSNYPVNFIQKYKKYFLPTLITLAVIVAGALVTIFVLGRSGEDSFEGDAKLTINVPNQSVSGSEISFEVLIENVSNTTLSEIGLDMFYPDSFLFIDATPDVISEDNRDQELPRFFKFEDLPAGQTHKLVVVGTLSGSVREIKTLKATLRYVPQNFQSTFKKESQASIVMLAPNLSLNLRGSAQIFAGQAGSYVAEIVNLSSETFTDVVVRLEDNNNFEYVTSTPNVEDAESDVVEWKIEQIKPGESKEIRFSGRLSQTLTGEVLLRLEQFLPGLEGELLSAGRSFVFTSVLSPPLRSSVSLKLGGVAASKDYYQAGDNLQFEIRYENQGLTALKNVIFNLDFEKDVFDFSRLRNTEGTAQRLGNTVTWIPGANSELRLLSPGQSGVFRFTLPVAQNLQERKIVNPLIKAELNYVADLFPEGVVVDSIEEKIGTNLSFQASRQTISTEGDESKYLITLVVDNSVNDVAQATVSAGFPGLNTSIDFDTTIPESEKSRFFIDSSSGVIRWDLGTVAALSKRQLSFELSTSASTLLSGIEFSGTDVFTGQGIEIRKGDLRN